MVGPATSVPILIFTKSQPRSLLSSARSKSARSRIRPSRSRKKRIDHICLIFRARLAPTCLPAFQAGLPAAAGSYCEIPIIFLLWPKRPLEKCGSGSDGGCRPHSRRSQVSQIFQKLPSAPVDSTFLRYAGQRRSRRGVEISGSHCPAKAWRYDPPSAPVSASDS